MVRQLQALCLSSIPPPCHQPTRTNMNSRTASALFTGTLIVATTALIWGPAVEGSPQASDSSPIALPTDDQQSSGQPQRATSTPTRQANTATSSRLATLELQVQQMARRGELEELRARVAELERARPASPPGVDFASRELTRDIAQLKSDLAALKRLHDQLARKVSTAQNEFSPARNDLRVLQQKVISLQQTVQRLESRH